MLNKVLIGLLVVSILPIWRDTRIEGGLNFWQYMGCWMSGKRKHITVEEAIRNYREYLNNVKE